MMFRVGQKVVRIGHSATGEGEWARHYSFTFPEIGDVVTIRTINEWMSGTLLTFFEHDNSHLAGTASKIEPGFGAEHFRPLVERKTDIEFAQEILRKASKKIPALAESPAVREGKNG